MLGSSADTPVQNLCLSTCPLNLFSDCVVQTVCQSIVNRVRSWRSSWRMDLDSKFPMEEQGDLDDSDQYNEKEWN
jgi:hypothetical protein